ncbi:MAG: redoxin domain-containing protein [Lachnospiraceae bacterium]|nr:redoxin domain-containing protein [Lachnospiraceae bacterium]
MKQKKIVLIITLGLVLVLGAAFVLYENLSGSVAGPSLAVDPAAQQEAAGTDDSGESAQAQEESTDASAQEAADNSSEEAESELTPAPDFTVYDADGNEHKLSSFEGKPVILNFWASWCGPCQMEMPDFETAYGEYGDEVHFVMVNLTDGGQETVEKATSFITDNGYTFPVYYDTESDAAATYGISAIPSTYFINSEGYLVARGQGALNLEALEEGVALIQGNS